MTWYKAPLFIQNDDFSDPDPANWVYEVVSVGITTSLGVSKWQPHGKYIVQGHDPVNMTCLVGHSVGLSIIPDGWTKLTVIEAKSEFETAKGRKATDKEIY